jgi:hypothetical protein
MPVYVTYIIKVVTRVAHESKFRTLDYDVEIPEHSQSNAQTKRDQAPPRIWHTMSHQYRYSHSKFGHSNCFNK